MAEQGICGGCARTRLIRYPSDGLCSNCYTTAWKSAQPKSTRDRYHAQSKPGVAARRAEKRQAVIDAKSRPCVDCGQSYPWYVMDLDHRDRSTKRHMVSAMISNSYSLQRLLVEIEKCDVRCANCHRIKTYENEEHLTTRKGSAHG